MHRAAVRLACELAGDDYADWIDNFGSRGPGLTAEACRAVRALGAIEAVDVIPAHDPASPSRSLTTNDVPVS